MPYVSVTPIKLRGYCRHILNIPLQDVGEYIKTNIVYLTQEINTLIENGQLMYNGKLQFRTGDYENKAFAYFINGRLLLVTDSGVTKLRGISIIDTDKLNRLQTGLKTEKVEDITRYIKLLIESTENWL